MFVVLLFFKRVDYSLRDARKMQVRFFSVFYSALI